MASVESGERGKGGKFSTQEWAGQMNNQIGQRLMPAKVGVDRKVRIKQWRGQRRLCKSVICLWSTREWSTGKYTHDFAVTQATSNLV